MNREFVNNRVSQLPIAMAGIVHAAVKDARGLSIYAHTDITTHEKTPTLTLKRINPKGRRNFPAAFLCYAGCEG